MVPTHVRRGGVPVEFAQQPMRAIRPADAVSVYPHPRSQLARLERNGLLHRLANGYYVVVPQDRVGQPWRPDLETAAAAIGAAAVGSDSAVLMGVSAARMHRVVPRALAVAVVATPQRRHDIQLRDRDAVIHFVHRETDALDAERMATELGGCLVTTVEQTALDLAHRPSLGHAEGDALEAIRLLMLRCDPDKLERLAANQRRGNALAYAQDLAA